MGRQAQTALAIVLGLAGCSGGDAPKRDAEADRKSTSEEKPGEAEAPASEPPPSSPPPTDAKSLADRHDPQWFHPNMLPEAKVVSSGRSEADENGLFSSQILFEFPAGKKTQDCVDELTAKLQPHGVTLAPMPGQEGKAGRVSLAGDGDGYRATVVCGEAKGSVRAYVGFQWLR